MNKKNIFPESKGYIFYDPNKCTGCKSCMLTCSLVHNGNHNISLSRLQIIDNPFGNYPTDIEIVVCKQCKYPLCISECPTDALFIDTDYLNVRIIDEQKCIGCKNCISACPFNPSMIIWNDKKQKTEKCDLCKNTPFWFKNNKLACVEVCPTGALMFSTEPPNIPGYFGYIVNLKNKGWESLGLNFKKRDEEC